MQPNLPLWDHQKKALEFSKTHTDLALFFDPGTGKTRTAIEILRLRMNEHKRHLKTLIICPLIVTETWAGEITKFSKISPSRVKILEGPGEKRVKDFEKNLEASIFILNYEGLLIQPLYEKILSWGPEFLIIDESHKVKTPSANRTKRLIKLSAQMQAWPVCYRLGLTGTPVLKNMMDLFSQFQVIDGGKTFGTNFFSFRAQYFYDKNVNMPKHIRFPLWLPKPSSEKELLSKVSHLSLTARKEECLDLPPLLVKQVSVELSPEQKTFYTQLKKDFITFVEDKACVASLAITKMLRMSQALSGFLKLDDGSIHTIQDNPRLKVLSELLEEITPSHKVIVWAVFHEDFKRLGEVCEKLKLPFVFLHGETPKDEKFKNMKSFNEDESVRVLIGSPGAGGIGVSLIQASYSIWYSRTHSLEHDIQAAARNYRGGSEIHEKITRIDLVAPGTLDELILKALSQKQDLSNQVLSLGKLL